MAWPIRTFDDKGVLRTDGSYPTIAQAYAAAERVWDPNDVPTQNPNEHDLYGKSGLNDVKTVFHQVRQMETAFLDRDDPTKMVDGAYSDDSSLT